MWGMIEANSPPPPVHPKSLELFSKSFSNFREVELVLQNAGSARLVAQGEIETLKQGRAGTLKLGRGLLYVNETTIHSIHSHLARLGIYLWGPDLTEAPDSLYNSACRLAALKLFREVALDGGIYANVNRGYLNDFTLLSQAYNHFVHYLSAARFRREIASPGKFQVSTMRSVILRRRQRVSFTILPFEQAVELTSEWFVLSSAMQSTLRLLGHPEERSKTIHQTDRQTKCSQ